VKNLQYAIESRQSFDTIINIRNILGVDLKYVKDDQNNLLNFLATSNGSLTNFAIKDNQHNIVLASIATNLALEAFDLALLLVQQIAEKNIAQAVQTSYKLVIANANSLFAITNFFTINIADAIRECTGLSCLARAQTEFSLILDVQKFSQQVILPNIQALVKFLDVEYPPLFYAKFVRDEYLVPSEATQTINVNAYFQFTTLNGFTLSVLPFSRATIVQVDVCLQLAFELAIYLRGLQDSYDLKSEYSPRSNYYALKRQFQEYK
jgi:hypothetical protein